MSIIFNKNNVKIRDNLLIIEDIIYDINDIISAEIYFDKKGSWGFVIMGILFSLSSILSGKLVLVIILFIFSLYMIPSTSYYLNLTISGNKLTLLYGENKYFIDEIVKIINRTKASIIINR
jgi:hypothetical protein